MYILEKEGGGKYRPVSYGAKMKKGKRQMSTVMCERQNIKDIKIKKKLQKGG